VDITGLTPGTDHWAMELPAAETKKLSPKAPIILEPGGTLAIRAVTGAVALLVAVHMYRRGFGFASKE
jgi:hypothetical protein